MEPEKFALARRSLPLLGAAQLCMLAAVQLHRAEVWSWAALGLCFAWQLAAVLRLKKEPLFAEFSRALPFLLAEGAGEILLLLRQPLYGFSLSLAVGCQVAAAYFLLRGSGQILWRSGRRSQTLWGTALWLVHGLVCLVVLIDRLFLLPYWMDTLSAACLCFSCAGQSFYYFYVTYWAGHPSSES